MSTHLSCPLIFSQYNLSETLQPIFTMDEKVRQGLELLGVISSLYKPKRRLLLCRKQSLSTLTETTHGFEYSYLFGWPFVGDVNLTHSDLTFRDNLVDAVVNFIKFGFALKHSIDFKRSYLGHQTHKMNRSSYKRRWNLPTYTLMYQQR